MPLPTTTTTETAPAAPSGQNPPATNPTTPASPAEGASSGSTGDGDRASGAEPGAENRQQQPVATEQQEPGADDDQFWRRLEELDPRDVVKRVRRLAGYVGSEADRLERDRETVRRQRWEADLKAARDREELQRLRKEDPYAYAERMEQAEQEQERQHHEAAQLEEQHAAMWSTVDSVLYAWHQSLPEEVKSSLKDQVFNVDNDPAKSRIAYLGKVSELLAEHAGNSAVQTRLQRELATLQGSIEEGARKDALSKVNGSQQVVDTGGGNSAPSDGPVDQAEWEAHKADRAWRRANTTRINRGLALGLIKGP